METSTIIIILAIILLIIIVLNNITVIVNSSSRPQGVCSQTTFGCCPDGVNSKVNYYGTNCPGYRPGPGYPIIPTPIPPGPGPNPRKPIGGCAGTQYGCCPNNIRPKFDPQGSNCILHNK
jgi:hypothetical protein